MKNNIQSVIFSLLSIFLISALLMSVNVVAKQTECVDSQQQENECSIARTWYIGGSYGRAETAINRDEISALFSANNLATNSISIDTKDNSFNLFVGYQFNSYLALEAGYLDLGERSVDFSGSTLDQSSYYDIAEHIYPQSGDGALFAVIASLPITEDFTLSGKLGLFNWRGDYITQDSQAVQGSDSRSGTDALFGLELNYNVSKSTAVYLNYQQTKLVDDKNTLWAIGVRYYFDSEN